MLAIFVIKCSVTIFDWRYRLWEVGVVMTNMVSAIVNLATGDFKVLFLFVCNLHVATSTPCYLGSPCLLQRVLYHIGYCVISLIGFQWSYFYFSIHLLDVMLESKLLVTVLNSLLINGKQVRRRC